MSLWRHALAIGLLPVVVTLVVPAAIVRQTRPVEVRWALALPGAVLIAAGLALVVWTIALFGTVGREPWRLGTPPRGSSSEAPTGTSGTR